MTRTRVGDKGDTLNCTLCLWTFLDTMKQLPGEFQNHANVTCTDSIKDKARIHSTRQLACLGSSKPPARTQSRGTVLD